MDNIPSLNDIQELTLVLLAIIAPLGLAYACVVLQDRRNSSRQPDDPDQKTENNKGHDQHPTGKP